MFAPETQHSDQVQLFAVLFASGIIHSIWHGMEFGLFLD
jgi:hypothetical protein